MLPQLAGVPAAQRRPAALCRAALLLALAPGMFHDPQSVASLNPPEQALALPAEAELQRNALDSQQADRLARDLLGMLHGSRAISHARLGQLDTACHDAQLAVRYGGRTVLQAPALVVVRDGLVTEATHAGVILLRLEDAPAALAATRVVGAPVQRPARENDAGIKWLEARPGVAQHHGRALLANGQASEAAAVLPEAVAQWQTRQAAALAAGQPVDHPRRMLAWMNWQQARALWGRGDHTVGLALAARQVPVLQALAAPPKAGDAMLNLGEAGWLMARFSRAVQVSPDRHANAAGHTTLQHGWLQRARDAYARATTPRPLYGDHWSNHRAAGGKA